MISNIQKLQSKNGKMLKFMDNLAICFLEIPVIPRFLTRFVKIPKAIDKIPNCVGPLSLVANSIHFSIILK